MDIFIFKLLNNSMLEMLLKDYIEFFNLKYKKSVYKITLIFFKWKNKKN